MKNGRLYPSPNRDGNQRQAATTLLLGLLLAGLLLLPAPSRARENLITGSLSLRQEYDSNLHLSETDSDRREAWFTTLSPGIIFTSSGRHDHWRLDYKPGLKRNLDSGETKLDHNLLLQGTAQPSSLWQIGLVNRYYHSDDSEYGGTPVVDVDRPLSVRRGRERFWTNRFRFSADYRFAEESVLGLAYDNQILESNRESRNDYVRHNPSLTLGHQLNRQWRAEGGYGYIRGEFDLTDDLETHTGHLRLVYLSSPHNQLSALYGLNQTTYQGPGGDYQLQTLLGGWLRQLDPKTTFSAHAGIAELDRDGQEDYSTLSFAADLSRKLERGQIKIAGAGGIGEMQFAGGGEGLSRYRQLQLSGHHQLTERLLTDLNLSLRHNKYIDRTGNNEETIYRAIVGLTYPFGQRYEISLRYLFRQLERDNGGDYEQHRVFLELKMIKDLLKW